MSIYVRQSRGGNWEGISENTEEDGRFPADVIADVVDMQTGETSIWQIGGLTPEQEKLVDELSPILRASADLHRVIAALHPASASKFADTTVRVISDYRLKGAGFRLKSERGETPDHELNRRGVHFAVPISTASDAMKFAKALADRPAILFPKGDVMSFFAMSLYKKWINPDRVANSIWKELMIGGHLQPNAAKNG